MVLRAWVYCPGSGCSGRSAPGVRVGILGGLPGVVNLMRILFMNFILPPSTIHTGGDERYKRLRLQRLQRRPKQLWRRQRRGALMRAPNARSRRCSSRMLLRSRRIGGLRHRMHTTRLAQPHAQQKRQRWRQRRQRQRRELQRRQRVSTRCRLPVSQAKARGSGCRGGGQGGSGARRGGGGAW
jgi:hypothetical protein